jgi:beta-phosphoglucomutase-like phosphatase (HAD superfamily)
VTQTQLSKFDAIILDFDGVIVDSVVLREMLLFRAFDKCVQISDYEKVIKFHIKNHGLTRSDRVSKIYHSITGNNITQSSLNCILDEIKSASKLMLPNCSLVQGIRNFLNYVVKESNIQLFVSSIAPSDEIDLLLSQKKIDTKFTKIWGGEISKTLAIKKVTSDYFLDINNVLFIGDRMSDFISSVDANVNFIGMVSESSTNPFPKDVPIIKDFNDFFTYEQITIL